MPTAISPTLLASDFWDLTVGEPTQAPLASWHAAPVAWYPRTDPSATRGAGGSGPSKTARTEHRLEERCPHLLDLAGMQQPDVSRPLGRGKLQLTDRVTIDAIPEDRRPALDHPCRAFSSAWIIAHPQHLFVAP